MGWSPARDFTPAGPRPLPIWPGRPRGLRRGWQALAGGARFRLYGRAPFRASLLPSARFRELDFLLVPRAASFLTERIRALRPRERMPCRSESPGSPALEAAVILFEAACQGSAGNLELPGNGSSPGCSNRSGTLHHRRYPENERRKSCSRRHVDSLSRRLDRPPSATELADAHTNWNEPPSAESSKRKPDGRRPPSSPKSRLEEALKLLRTQAKLEEVATDRLRRCEPFLQSVSEALSFVAGHLSAYDSEEIVPW